MESTVGMSGAMNARKVSTPKPPLEWQLRQMVRTDRIHGLVGNSAAKAFAKLFGLPVVYSQLNAVYINGETGERINYGTVSRRVVTTAFVTMTVANLVAETTEWGDYKFHDSGVGTTPAVIGDTDIETTDGEARVTGSQVNVDPIYRSVGTITYTGSLAITEHGLFSIVTGGTLMDRHVFTAINVVNTDSIEFTYELTIDSGG